MDAGMCNPSACTVLRRFGTAGHFMNTAIASVTERVWAGTSLGGGDVEPDAQGVQGSEIAARAVLDKVHNYSLESKVLL